MGNEAEDLARRLHDEVRRRVLRRVLRTDARISRMYDQVGARLRQRLRLIGMTDAQVTAALREEFDRVEAELLPHLETELSEAAEQGDTAAARTLDRIQRLAPGSAPFASAPASRPQPTRVKRR